MKRSGDLPLAMLMRQRNELMSLVEDMLGFIEDDHGLKDSAKDFNRRYMYILEASNGTDK